jgi:hypothetical protein
LLLKHLSKTALSSRKRVTNYLNPEKRRPRFEPPSKRSSA